MYFEMGCVTQYILQMVSVALIGMTAAYTGNSAFVTACRVSLLTSNRYSLYILLVESITTNLPAVIFVLIAGPLSDVETASFAPMMVCAIAGILAMVVSEIAWQAYDSVVIRHEDEKDAETVLRLVQVLRKTQRTDIVHNPTEYAAFCRAHMLTTKQRDKLRDAAEVPEAVN